MKNNFRKTLIRFISVCLTLALLASITFTVSGSTRYFSGDAENYYNSLLNAGFPEDYAISLTELHLLHPHWQFEPLLITEEASTYTWDYIIQKENHDASNPENNLIFSSDTYKPYHHPFNKEIYDSAYYQVSDQGLEYFMDPRNFLNETDIFQFFDLSADESVTEEAVQAILIGTFMENAFLENGKPFAEYFVEIGNELGVNPIYLAVKARQEQGVGGTSPLISGKCGTVLADFYQNQTQETESGLQVLAPSEGYTADALTDLNGYYNFFNIGASGKGLFKIYHNAMTRAINGTSTMTDAWGSPAWDTMWKSIYGGAYIIKNNYIDSYQNTIYLQKFNVDSRASSGNFWKQYMQNVSGAISEARTLYTAFASMGALDAECMFLIPVYGGMPTEASPDPANGDCSYVAKATEKYDYSVFLTSPLLVNTSNSAVYHTTDIYAGGVLKLDGTVDHSYEVNAMEYRWDNGEWTAFSADGTVDLSLPVNFLAGSSHILSIRGVADYDHGQSAKKSNYHFLCAVLYVNVLAPPNIDVTLRNRGEQTVLTYPMGTLFPLPSYNEEHFYGWYGTDNTLHPAGSVTTVTEDITYEALYLGFEKQIGAALVFSDSDARLRFFSAIEKAAYDRLNEIGLPLELYATVTANERTVLTTPLLRETVTAFGTEWIMLYTDTEAIDVKSAQTTYAVDFYAILSYTNGAELSLKANAEPFTRTAMEVANAALQDDETQYSDAIKEKLQQFAGNTEF
ncbi:MAG: hypothetical protein IJX80_06335 [Clostridia bacterium]|nr:hypothetical protein [Clostridia bacterium]